MMSVPYGGRSLKERDSCQKIASAPEDEAGGKRMAVVRPDRVELRYTSQKTSCSTLAEVDETGGGMGVRLMFVALLVREGVERSTSGVEPGAAEGGDMKEASMSLSLVTPDGAVDSNLLASTISISMPRQTR